MPETEAAMPHVTLVPFTGFRVREEAMHELGMSLPGLQRRAGAIAELPALGLLTLAGMTPDHWTCSYRGAEFTSEDLVEWIIADQPALVAISALTASIEEAYDLSRRLRRRDIKVALGGLHATACPEEAAQHCDAVVVGEGESVWTRLLMDVESSGLANIYRAAGSESAFAWPAPRLDLLGADPPRFTLQTQRGCPLACEFCGASRLLGRFREKPIENIRRELAAICEISPRPLLELADDNTFVHRPDAMELLDALGESQARWFTEADWRLAERPEVLARLAGAGCAQILVGIESLVFRYPGQGRKQAELDRMMDAVRAIQESGVCVNGCFIVGADGETPQSLDRLVEFILDSPLAEVQVTLQTPFPGTALHCRLQEEGRLLPDRGWPHYTLFDVTYRPDRMHVDELERAFREALRKVYSEGPSRRREAIRREVWRRNKRLCP